MLKNYYFDWINRLFSELDIGYFWPKSDPNLLARARVFRTTHFLGFRAGIRTDSVESFRIWNLRPKNKMDQIENTFIGTEFQFSLNGITLKSKVVSFFKVWMLAYIWLKRHWTTTRFVATILSSHVMESHKITTECTHTREMLYVQITNWFKERKSVSKHFEMRLNAYVCVCVHSKNNGGQAMAKENLI